MSVMISPRGLGVFSWFWVGSLLLVIHPIVFTLPICSRCIHVISIQSSSPRSCHLLTSQHHECQEYDPSLSLLDAEWAYLSVRFVFPQRWCAAIVPHLVIVRHDDVKELAVQDDPHICQKPMTRDDSNAQQTARRKLI